MPRRRGGFQNDPASLSLDSRVRIKEAKWPSRLEQIWSQKICLLYCGKKASSQKDDEQLRSAVLAEVGPRPCRSGDFLASVAWLEPSQVIKLPQVVSVTFEATRLKVFLIISSKGSAWKSLRRQTSSLYQRRHWQIQEMQTFWLTCCLDANILPKVPSPACFVVRGFAR